MTSFKHTFPPLPLLFSSLQVSREDVWPRFKPEHLCCREIFLFVCLILKQEEIIIPEVGMEADVRGSRDSQKACWLRLWEVSSMSIATQQEHCRCKENHSRTHSQKEQTNNQKTLNNCLSQAQGNFSGEGLSADIFFQVSAILRKTCGIWVPQCCWATEVKIDSRRDIVFCWTSRTILSELFAMKDHYSSSDSYSPLTQETHTLFLALLHSLGKVALPSCSFLDSACIKPWFL